MTGVPGCGGRTEKHSRVDAPRSAAQFATPLLDSEESRERCQMIPITRFYKVPADDTRKTRKLYYYYCVFFCDPEDARSAASLASATALSAL